jgi:hypothetical protein
MCCQAKPFTEEPTLCYISQNGGYDLPRCCYERIARRERFSIDDAIQNGMHLKK